MADVEWEQMLVEERPRAHKCSTACRHQYASPVLPFKPLWDAARCSSAGELALMVGRSRKQIERWKTAGGVPVSQADEVACALGMHPASVWTDWWLL